MAGIWDWITGNMNQGDAVGAGWQGNYGGYGFTMDPQQYASGFTNLNAGLQNQYGMGGLGGQMWQGAQNAYGSMGGAINNANAAFAGMPTGMDAGMMANAFGAYGGMPISIERQGINNTMQGMMGGLGATQNMIAGINPQQISQFGVGLMNGQNVGSPVSQFLGGGYGQGLANLAIGQTSPIEQAMNASMRNVTRNTIADVGQELSGMGALYSSALGDIAGQRIGEANAAQAANLATTRAGVAGQLMGQGLGVMGNQANTAQQLAMQGVLGGAQTGLSAAELYGNMSNTVYGQQLGVESSLAQQNAALQQARAGALGGAYMNAAQQNAALAQAAAQAQGQGYLTGAGMYGSAYGTGLQGATNLGSAVMNSSDYVAPQTQYNSTGWQQYGQPLMQSIGGAITGAASGFATGGVGGAILGGLGGLFGATAPSSGTGGGGGGTQPSQYMTQFNNWLTGGPQGGQPSTGQPANSYAPPSWSGGQAFPTGSFGQGPMGSPGGFGGFMPQMNYVSGAATPGSSYVPSSGFGFTNPMQFNPQQRSGPPAGYPYSPNGGFGLML